ncbi:hypothetical protein D3C71_2001300 [compost metagenome]
MPLLLQFNQHAGGDSFDLRHDVIRTFLFNHGFQRVAVQHVNNVAAMGDVHGRGIGVTIYGNHFQPQTLAFDGNFFTQLAGAEQHNAGGGGAQGGSNS